MNERVRFAIDAGGTTTRLVVAGTANSTGAIVALRSINPASVTADDAVTLLRTALRQVAAHVVANGIAAVQGVIASAAVSRHTIDYWTSVTTNILSDLGIAGTVVLTNDIDALLMAPPLNGMGGVLVAGTGSGAMIANEEGKVVRIGGWEYLASDEGSAFWLGRAGLAAAVRATDGRGEFTSVTERIEAQYGGSIGKIARTLAELSHPRQAVAKLAPCVTEAWTHDGDRVAEALVAAAIEELALLVSTGVRRIGSPPASWVLTGGLLVKCAELTRLLKGRVSSASAGASIHVLPEPVCAIMNTSPMETYPLELVRKTIEVTT